MYFSTYSLCLLLQQEEEFGSLGDLQILRLNNNRLKFLPASLGACHSLQILALEQNHLEVFPDSIGRLTALKERESECVARRDYEGAADAVREIGMLTAKRVHVSS